MKVVINVSGWVEFEIKSAILDERQLKEGINSKDLLLSLFNNDLVDLNLLFKPMSNPVVGSTEIIDYDLEYTTFED